MNKNNTLGVYSMDNAFIIETNDTFYFISKLKQEAINYKPFEVFTFNDYFMLIYENITNYITKYDVKLYNVESYITNSSHLIITDFKYNNTSEYYISGNRLLVKNNNEYFFYKNITTESKKLSNIEINTYIRPKENNLDYNCTNNPDNPDNPDNTDNYDCYVLKMESNYTYSLVLDEIKEIIEHNNGYIIIQNDNSIRLFNENIEMNNNKTIELVATSYELLVSKLLYQDITFKGYDYNSIKYEVSRAITSDKVIQYNNLISPTFYITKFSFYIINNKKLYLFPFQLIDDYSICESPEIYIQRIIFANEYIALNNKNNINKIITNNYKNLCYFNYENNKNLIYKLNYFDNTFNNPNRNYNSPYPPLFPYLLTNISNISDFYLIPSNLIIIDDQGNKYSILA